MTNIKKAKSLTTEEKSKSMEIARLIAQIPEQEQMKIYYMLKGSEIFNSIALTASAPTADSQLHPA
jgi:hypothetical protein